ncbi:MAG TPA: polygalacturonase [Prevotella sp.]|nr:polygalacturonase [Prevotella sp.]
MKKYYHIFLMLVIVLLAGLSLTACDSGDDLNTDQYGNDISLNAFGPCPVLRGGTLYFYGSNLDQITEVDLPNADPITSINVLASGKHSEISITVPAEKCDTGIVSLKTAKGGTIQTVTPIKYREDISVSEFYVGTSGTLVGNVGDVLTIKGDYLNLIHGVIFQEKDTVTEDQFVTHDRYTIQVAIPAAAKTGKLILTDLAAEPTELETEEALTVNLPTVASISPVAPKAGQTVTVSGKDLDQIASVQLNGATVEADAFLSQTATALAFTLPATATDGEVTLVTKSGVELSAGSITTVVPTDLAATPNPVKNGAVLTITGKDLDLVTSVTFPKADAVAPTTCNTSKLTVVVPEKAQDGDITLSLANGKSVTVACSLVKPTVTACTPSVLTAGNSVLIKGADLDLVLSISFPGDNPIEVSSFGAQTASAIAVTVPAAAYGKGFTLNLKNGTTVDVTSGLTINAASDPAVSKTTNSGHPGAYVTVEGKNFNNVETVYIGSVKITKFSSRSNTSMTFLVPSSTAAGTYDLIMKDYDGKSYTVGKFEVVPNEIDLATSVTTMSGSAISYPFNFTWDDAGRFRVMKAFLTGHGVKEGSKLIFYKSSSATGQIQVNDSKWSSLITVADWGGTEAQVVYTFDAAGLAAVNSISDGWSDTALILQGDLKSITKMVFVP